MAVHAKLYITCRAYVLDSLNSEPNEAVANINIFLNVILKRHLELRVHSVKVSRLKVNDCIMICILNFTIVEIGVLR